MVKIRVAYYGIDRFGSAVVMVSHDYHDAQRPGWSQGITQSFRRVEDLRDAKNEALIMKARHQVDLVKAL